MEREMKKIGMKMSLLMGVSLSFCLSLVGNLTSGHFTVPGFLISFVLSTLISLVIGFLIPMKKVSDGVCDRMGLKPGLGRRCMETLLSDLIYTPVITLVMVAFAHKMATRGGAQIPFLPMFLRSLVISLLVGYVLIFILMPVFLGMLTKNMPQGGPPEGVPGKEGPEA